MPWKERWLEHNELPLAGRPDLVEYVDGELCVIDLKTGLQQAERTNHQQVQLLLYCAIVGSILGKEPTLLAIETTKGRRYPFEVEKDAVRNAVIHAVSMLDHMNSAGEDGLSATMATPAEGSCGWCSYRPICAPFLQAYEEDWQIPHALLFRILSVKHSQHGYEVEAAVLKPHWRSGEHVHVLGFPFELEPQKDEIWGAVDFAGRAQTAIAVWNTRVARWEPR